MSDALEAAVANLDTVKLDVLIGDASLETRRDRKYAVPVTRLESLLEDSGLQVLQIDGQRVFNYESIYFDTPTDDSYLGAAHRRRRRFKVRSRSYLDSDLCWLEVKTKAPRRKNAKARLPYDFRRRTNLTGAGLSFVQSFTGIAPISHELRPVITTRYRRATLLEPQSNSRVTVDIGVEWITPDGSHTTLPDVAIVETKTDGPPCATDHRLWGAQFRPEKISKYCIGRAALDPTLPANKWERVLRRYMDRRPARPEPRLAPVVWITQPDRSEGTGPHQKERRSRRDWKAKESFS